MNKRLAGVLAACVIVVSAGGAVAVANSVDTEPEPAYVSHYTDSTGATAPATGTSPATAPAVTVVTVDDHGGRAGFEGSGGTTPGTFDDHGGDRDRSGRSTDDTTDDTTGVTAPTVSGSTPATVEDDGGRRGRGRSSDD